MYPWGAKLKEYLARTDEKESGRSVESPMAGTATTLDPTISIACRHELSFPQQWETHTF
jgi:hypothetical protein